MVWTYEKYTPIVRDWIDTRQSNRIGLAELDQLISRTFGINDKTLRTHKKALIAHGFLVLIEGQIYEMIPDPAMSRLEKKESQEKVDQDNADTQETLDAEEKAVLGALPEEQKPGE